MTNEKKQEFTLRITSANSTELIEILYEMLLEYVEDAKAAIEKNDINEIHDAIRKARGCLRELMESIDFEYDIAGYFMSLYAYVNKELLLAEIRKDVKVFDNVKVVIEPLRTSRRDMLCLVTYKFHPVAAFDCVSTPVATRERISLLHHLRYRG